MICSMIKNSLVNTFMGTSRFASSSSKELLKKRQEELMKRGLPKRKQIEGVKNVLLVSSGKGGVGKSTVAVNLALAISNLNHRVCLLDADIYGPSIPIMMNLSESPILDIQDKMIPLQNYGVGVMSMGNLVSSESAVVWRGPMVMGALNKLIFSTNWGDTDYLVIDTPPGTGDIHLSLTQTVSISGALVVTTPQLVARADVRKGVDMFNKLGVPVLGMVQNMSSFTCGNCGHINQLFGHDETLKMAESLNIDMLGDVPLDPQIAHSCDSGVPLVISHPNSQAAKVYGEIAEKICSQIFVSDC